MILFWMLALGAPALAQQPQSENRDAHDAGNKLVERISPSGERIFYEYDAAGNLILIRREAAAALEILSFSPSEGPVGTKVTILGKGFGMTPTANVVTFNGTPATVLSAAAGRLEVVVPPGSTTGPVTVAVTGPTLATIAPFTVVTGVTLTPPGLVIAPGGTFQFEASVAPPAAQQDIVWSVNGVPGGNVSTGTISQSGLYAAPSSIPNVQTPLVIQLRAASAAFPSVFRDIPVTVRPDIPTPSFAMSVRVGAEIPAANGRVTVAYAIPTTGASQGITVSYGSLPTVGELRGLTVNYDLPPVITGLSVASGAPGASVVISGRNFLGAVRVSFNGIAASGTVNGDGTEVTVTVPAGATSGPVVVRTPIGAATAAASFTVTPN
jgi:YD repeat-containing protein